MSLDGSEGKAFAGNVMPDKAAGLRYLFFYPAFLMEGKMKKTKDLTQGPILGSLLRFAVPVLFAMFLQSLYGGVDLLIVGQFAATGDVSGVSTGSTLMQTVTMVVTGLAMGLTIHVGQKIGEKNTEEAGRTIGAGIAVFLVCGLIMTVMMGVFTSFFADLLHAPAQHLQPCFLRRAVCSCH